MKSLLKYVFISLLIIQTLSCNMDNKTPDKPTPEDNLPNFEYISNEIYSGSINYGETVEIKSFTHSVDNYDTGEFHSGNSHKSNLAIENCYIYEFTATSKYLTIEPLENLSTEVKSGYKLSPIAIRFFTKDGKQKQYYLSRSANRHIINTNVGEKYYIGIIPIESIYNGSTYKSDTIKFIIKEYNDTNISPETAKEISIGKYYSNYLTGDVDVDYYKVSLNAGTDYIINSKYRTNYSITSPTGEILDTDNYLYEKKITATTTGDHIIKLSISNSVTFEAEYYSLYIVEIDPAEAINPSSNWIDTSVSPLLNNYYYLNLDNSKDYSITWKDKTVDQNYTGEVSLALFSSHSINSYPIYGFESYKATDLRIFDLSQTETDFILCLGNSSILGSGSFTFKIEEVTTHPTCTSVPLGVHTIADINDGVTQFYKFTIDQSKKYILKTLDRGTDHTKYEGDATISIYTPGKVEYLIQNIRSGFDSNISFSDTTDPNTELILRIHITPGSYSHDWEPIGTIGFELVEDTSNP